MNADLLAVLDGAATATMAVLGEAATYDYATGAAPTAVQVAVSELPGGLVQARYGQDRQRVADITIRLAALPSEAKEGHKIKITDGSAAGLWTVLGVERRDAVVVVVRARRADRVNTAPSGVREVQR